MNEFSEIIDDIWSDFRNHFDSRDEVETLVDAYVKTLRSVFWRKREASIDGFGEFVYTEKQKEIRRIAKERDRKIRAIKKAKKHKRVSQWTKVFIDELI